MDFQKINYIYFLYNFYFDFVFNWNRLNSKKKIAYIGKQLNVLESYKENQEKK